MSDPRYWRKSRRHRRWLIAHCRQAWADGFRLVDIAASIGATSHATASYWIRGGLTPSQYRLLRNAEK